MPPKTNRDTEGATAEVLPECPQLWNAMKHTFRKTPIAEWIGTKIMQILYKRETILVIRQSQLNSHTRLNLHLIPAPSQQCIPLSHMPRPKKYHTDEDRKAANAFRSRKSYAK